MKITIKDGAREVTVEAAELPIDEFCPVSGYSGRVQALAAAAVASFEARVSEDSRRDRAVGEEFGIQKERRRCLGFLTLLKDRTPDPHSDRTRYGDEGEATAAIRVRSACDQIAADIQSGLPVPPGSPT
jgi:hypothetical protein